MSLIEEISSIETPSTRDLNWYYHAIREKPDDIKNMLSEGIKCRKLLGRKGDGNNGQYFISLSKDIGADESLSAFHDFRKSAMNIIIDNIEARRCYHFLFYPFLANTRFPVRFSGFPDEFQTYKMIEPDKFVGVQCPLYYWIECYEEDEIYKYFLDAFKDLIIVMKLLESSFPLYDYSRLQGTSVHQINPDEFLLIYDESIGELTNEEKLILQKNENKRLF